MKRPCPPASLKPLVIYHSPCPDGFGAAWAYWRRYGDSADYLPLAYGEEAPNVSGRHVVMVDVALDRDSMDRMASQAKSFQLLDHHDSTERDLKGLPYVHFDQSHSGAHLGWAHAHPGDPVPELIAAIEDRDLWRWTHPETSGPITQVLDTLPYTFEAWDALHDRLTHDREGVLTEGRVMEHQMDRWCHRLANQAVPVVQQGLRGLAVNVPREFASHVGNILAERADFAFTWVLGSNGKVQASWRSSSTHGQDIIPLAREYGGGGHPHASGARMSMDQVQAFLGSVPHHHHEAAGPAPTRPRSCCR